MYRALKALWQYLGSKGVNTTVIWEKIKDIVIKTIIAYVPREWKGSSVFWMLVRKRGMKATVGLQSKGVCCVAGRIRT